LDPWSPLHFFDEELAAFDIWLGSASADAASRTLLTRMASINPWSAADAAESRQSEKNLVRTVSSRGEE
jgi:hypothetical protein